MKKLTNKSTFVLFFSLILLIVSCENTDPTVIIPSEPEPEQTDPINPTPETIGPIQFFNRDRIDSNYILVNDAKSNAVYIIDKDGEVLFDFPLNEGRLGNLWTRGWNAS